MANLQKKVAEALRQQRTEPSPAPKEQRKPPPRDPLAVGAERAGEILGLSRSYIFKLMNEGDLPFVLIGHRRLIEVSAIKELLERNRQLRPQSGPEGGAA